MESKSSNTKRQPLSGKSVVSTVRRGSESPVLWSDMNALIDQIAEGVAARLGLTIHATRPASKSSTPRAKSSPYTAEKKRKSENPADASQLLRELEATFRKAGVLSQAEWRAQVVGRADMLSADEVSARLGISSRSEVLKWTREHRLFSVMPPGRQRGQRFPKWQIDTVGPDFSTILTELAHQQRSDWAIYEFFDSPAAKLFGLAPHELLLGSTQREGADQAALPLLKKPKVERYAQVLDLVREGPQDA
jgi:hypothetical protein